MCGITAKQPSKADFYSLFWAEGMERTKETEKKGIIKALLYYPVALSAVHSASA